MDLNQGQQAAFSGISQAVEDNDGLTILLQGPAGTGKTAVLGRILQNYIANNPKATNPGFDQWGRQLPGQLCVAAMSHKAKGEVARSLANFGITDHPIITCDQLLKARPVTDPQTRQKVTMRQQLPLEATYKFIVIDEVSMMSQQYFDWIAGMETCLTRPSCSSGIRRSSLRFQMESSALLFKDCDDDLRSD